MPLSRRAALATLALATLLPRRATAQEAPEQFVLTTHDGRRLSDRDLRGAPYALFFGFTNCPEICPTALFELSQVLGELGPEADRLRVFFVTVDPERDTPEQLATYISSFDPRIVALRGTPEETAKAAAAFKATYRRVPGESGYTMEHTALVFLVDREGRYFDRIDYRAPHAEQLARFRRLLAAP
ncbi:SCO family protein [Ancylobacter sp. G4_0304]|uniref:SCO family protein n=1 Tax=Ancylobacter sp. G4_0304 TaxID=3114289 RepID=UPI0039C60276